MLHCVDIRRSGSQGQWNILSPVYSDTTQLNSTQLDVELSWVELCRYKRGLNCFSPNICCLPYLRSLAIFSKTMPQRTGEHTSFQRLIFYKECSDTSLIFFIDLFIANFLLRVSVKELWKSANIWRRYGQEFGVSCMTHDAAMISLGLSRTRTVRYWLL